METIVIAESANIRPPDNRPSQKRTAQFFMKFNA